MLQIEIITPEQIHSTATVAMAVLPAQDGEIGILPDHAPIISALKEGEIRLYGQDDRIVTETMTITGGFMEMLDNKCTVLAENIISK